MRKSLNMHDKHPLEYGFPRRFLWPQTIIQGVIAVGLTYLWGSLIGRDRDLVQSETLRDGSNPRRCRLDFHVGSVHPEKFRSLMENSQLRGLPVCKHWLVGPVLTSWRTFSTWPSMIKDGTLDKLNHSIKLYKILTYFISNCGIQSHFLFSQYGYIPAVDTQRRD